MRVLVATTRTQGQRPGDFTHTIDGELVSFGTVLCARDREDPDGPDACGCGRSFVGLNSAKGTTTAEVREVDMSMAGYVEAVRSSLEQAGWGPPDFPDGSREVAEELLDVVGEWEPGTVVERRLDEITVRTFGNE